VVGASGEAAAAATAAGAETTTVAAITGKQYAILAIKGALPFVAFGFGAFELHRFSPLGMPNNDEEQLVPASVILPWTVPSTCERSWPTPPFVVMMLQWTTSS
jgi:hypothetical protein